MDGRSEGKETVRPGGGMFRCHTERESGSNCQKVQGSIQECMFAAPPLDSSESQGLAGWRSARCALRIEACRWLIRPVDWLLACSLSNWWGSVEMSSRFPSTITCAFASHSLDNTMDMSLCPPALECWPPDNRRRPSSERHLVRSGTATALDMPTTCQPRRCLAHSAGGVSIELMQDHLETRPAASPP